MVHPSDAELEGFGDGELAPEYRQGLLLHFEECGECSGRLRSLEVADRQIAEWLSLLDHPVPRLDPATLMVGARRSAHPGLLAAGVATLLLAAAAAAAVLPGSPVHRLVERAIAEWRGGPPPSPEAPPSPPPSPRQSGVSFVPESPLEIAFTQAQAEGIIRLSLVAAPEVRIREVGGAAAYVLNPAELTVDNRNARGSYEILLPRSLARVHVRIGERVVFEKEGAAISSVGSVDDRGRHVVPFAPDVEQTRRQ